MATDRPVSAPALPPTVLPWHRTQWQSLLRRKGNLPHALLFSGPTGLGKTHFAEQLAAALLCIQPLPDGHACGVCPRCRLLKAGAHADYLRITLEDSAFIKIDQVRAASTFLTHTSQFGGYKIVCLVPADRLNLAAANSLLKTLEEPPNNSLLLLITAQPFKLPATVRSRCQRILFHPPPPSEAIAWLQSQGDHDDWWPLLQLAQGIPLNALAYRDSDRLERRTRLFTSYCALYRDRDPLQTAALWTQGDVLENLSWLISWQMDLVRLSLARKPPIRNPDLAKPLRELATQSSPAQWMKRLQATEYLYRTCTTTAVNIGLLLETLFADIDLTELDDGVTN